MEDTLFFFGSNHYLSNWYPATFEMLMSGTKYTFYNVEQAMMAGKAHLFKDKEMFNKILSTTDPKTIKRLGRKVKNFDPVIWDKYKKHIVKVAVTCKFLYNPELKQKLLSTGTKYIAEDSPYDRIWGIGTKSVKLKSTRTWPGQNLLGIIMMEVREELING